MKGKCKICHIIKENHFREKKNARKSAVLQIMLWSRSCILFPCIPTALLPVPLHPAPLLPCSLHPAPLNPSSPFPYSRYRTVPMRSHQLGRFLKTDGLLTFGSVQRTFAEKCVEWTEENNYVIKILDLPQILTGTLEPDHESPSWKHLAVGRKRRMPLNSVS